VLALQVLHDVEDLCLHRDVESRSRLVRRQKLGLRCQRTRDRDALSLSARETDAGTCRTSAGASPTERSNSATCAFRSAERAPRVLPSSGASRPCSFSGSADDVGDLPTRVQAGVRVLKDHLHTATKCKRGARAQALRWFRCRRSAPCRAVGAYKPTSNRARPCSCRSPIRRPAPSVLPRSIEKLTPSTAWTNRRGLRVDHAVQPRRRDIEGLRQISHLDQRRCAAHHGGSCGGFSCRPRCSHQSAWGRMRGHQVRCARRWHRPNALGQRGVDGASRRNSQ